MDTLLGKATEPKFILLGVVIFLISMQDREEVAIVLGKGGGDEFCLAKRETERVLEDAGYESRNFRPVNVRK